MSKEKQMIEEMAREMCHLSAECKTCQICNERYHGDDDLCYFQCVAKEIINRGYRKQSENTIELPCKVGDTVYCIEHKTIHECLVTMVKSLTFVNETKFFVDAECEIVSPFYSDGRKIKHGLSAVWKIEWGSWYRAFPTREEAEEALAKMKGGAE